MFKVAFNRTVELVSARYGSALCAAQYSTALSRAHFDQSNLFWLPSEGLRKVRLKVPGMCKLTRVARSQRRTE